MTRRTSVLLDDSTYDRLERRARSQGSTVSEEIRRALERDLADENPNQWLLDLADSLADMEWTDGPPVDSQEAQDRRARDLYRDTFNREPEW